MTELTFEELLAKYPNGLPVGFQAKKVYLIGIEDYEMPIPNSDPTPVPVAKVSTYRIVENDPNPNGKIKVYKTPDINDSNFETLIVAKNTITAFDDYRDVPNGLVGWSSQTEAGKINIYRDWMCTDMTIAYNINGKAFEFPTIIYANMSHVKHVWVRRADLGAKVV